MAACPDCNTVNENDAWFCYNCGRSLESRSLIPATTTKGLIDAESRNSLVNDQESTLAVEQLAEFMDELKSKAALDHAEVGDQCFEITSNSGSIEKVCYSIHYARWHAQGNWNLSLELLTKRLIAAFLPPPTVPALLQGKTEPAVPGAGLFDQLASLLGFSNFLPSSEDRDGMKERLAAFCADIFKRLHESATLSAGDWQQLREAAACRVHGRLWARLLSGTYDPQVSAYLFYKGSCYLFSYSRSYSKDDLYPEPASPLVKQIVAGEERRLAAFLTALHNTLQVLPAVGAMRHNRGISPPEDTEQMIDFLYLLHSVLTSTVDQDALLSPLPAFRAVTVVNSEPTAENEVVIIQRQLQAKEAELCTANQQIEGLKEQLALLEPQVMSEKALESYYDYKRRLQEAASRERVNGVQPQWEINWHRDYIETLIYSFDPSGVAFSLRELDDVEAGKRRVISNEAFWHFAEVLGYSNLYQYLLQEKPALLQMLLNLAVPTTRIAAVWVLDSDAVDWLIKHPPPRDNVPNSPCYAITTPDYIWQEYSWRYAGPALIEFEKLCLLDFRRGLYIAASLFAPALPEERDQQEQSLTPSQAVPHAVPPPFSDQRV